MTERSKKKVLIIMPYDNIYPPKNGGMIRCYNLFKQWSKLYFVDAIVHQDISRVEDSFTKNNEFEYTTVYSTSDKGNIRKNETSRFRKYLNAIRYRIITRRFNTITDSSFLKLYPILITLLRKFKYDAIILENLGLISQVDFFKRHQPNAIIIYDAYNVDSLLEKQINPSKDNKALWRKLEETESALHKNIDILLCCSENDKAIFQKLNSGKLENIFVVPNGVDIEKFKYRGDVMVNSMKKILFCGSLDYRPNKEGLLWFYEKIWPLIREMDSEIKLVIVGRGNKDDYKLLIKDNSVDFVGEVEELYPYYHDCCISIAPLLSGSGTRLKILEAMSFGTPVISTEIGAEGILYNNGINILIANKPTEFANKIIELTRNAQLINELSYNGRKLVEDTYSWDKIGFTLGQVFN
ncbi:glycosyltransferase family 4 protein [Flavihumibacter profundi]|uniref:glycosyltransferase family 4 protein n=1 Tax=Flavihumibacter profundi TaxID=2716883 RepID=UPI001CC69F97|nr:glycosyltransferase family 4 protein [Flavihumibacter profundi]MBZ5857991.1 glycosyltransferase family 4 protein [Flavihumibacter profundi]